MHPWPVLLRKKDGLMKARTVMIHQQVNRRHAVHLHQRAKPEKGTERE